MLNILPSFGNDHCSKANDVHRLREPGLGGRFLVGMGEAHPMLRALPTHSSAKWTIMSALMVSSGGESDPYRPFREKLSSESDG
jgi:hypothetical protein